MFDKSAQLILRHLHEWGISFVPSIFVHIFYSFVSLYYVIMLFYYYL